MSAPPEPEAKIRIRRGRWTRVYAEVEGRDVSHLGYAAKELGLGECGAVRMAGIGGVGTEPEFRRRGLAGRVLGRAMREMRREGFSCVGLFTSSGIVAHRLYRRFGLVDIVRERPAYKILDPERFLCAALSDMLGRDQALGAHRVMIEVGFGAQPAICVLWEHGEARVSERRGAECALRVEMPGATVVAVRQREVCFRYAEAAGLVRWEGKREVYRMLRRALTSWYTVLDQGEAQ